MPTSRRDFTRADRVAAFARVYRSDRTRNTSVELRIKLLDDAGAAVVDRIETMEPGAFAKDAAADVSIVLPLASLRTGSYLLTIETGLPTALVTRHVRFQVRD